MNNRAVHLLCSFLLGIALLVPAAASGNTQTGGFISEVYVHDCCGRGPYVGIFLDRPLNGQPGCSVHAYITATSPNAPLAAYLLATALSAKRNGRQVVIYTKGSCDSTGVFDEWIGIELL